MISELYEKVSVIVTSSKSFETWAEMIGDSVMTTALLDRLLHHARIFTLSGESYRIKKSRAEDLLLLKKTVRNLHENKIPVYAVCCGENRTNIAGWIQHIGECRLSCNEIAVVVDGKRSLIGILSRTTAHPRQ